MTTARKLKKFRQHCERQAGVPATRIKLSLAHVLDDLCRVHGLSGKQRRQVLGRRGITMLDDMQTWRIALKSPVTQNTQNTPK